VATIPAFFTGRHVYSVTIDALASVGSGLLEAGSGGTAYAPILTFVADHVEYNGRCITQEVNCLTSPYENNIVVERDDTVTIREIMRPVATQNLLFTLWNRALTTTDGSLLTNYCLVTLKYGNLAGGAGNQFVFYGVLSDYRENMEKGKSTAELTIRVIDILGTNGTTNSLISSVTMS
jgi:hypothetical protein